MKSINLCKDLFIEFFKLSSPYKKVWESILNQIENLLKLRAKVLQYVLNKLRFLRIYVQKYSLFFFSKVIRNKIFEWNGIFPRTTVTELIGN